MKPTESTNGEMGNAARLTNSSSSTTTPATEPRALARAVSLRSTPLTPALGSVAHTYPDPEVKPARRKYSAQYKLQILQQADNCHNGGEVGALLRREGLYSSHLTKWRRQRAAGQLAALEPQKRGVKATEVNPLRGEVARLQRENQRLQNKLKQAETIIDVQKNSHNYWASLWTTARGANLSCASPLQGSRHKGRLSGFEGVKS